MSTYDFTRDDEGTIYRLCMGDIYGVLEGLGKSGKDLNDGELRRIIKGVENGMSEYWYDIVDSAVRDVLDD